VVNLGSKNILGILVHAVDYDAALELILGAATEGRRMAVSALAVHGVMEGVLDQEIKYRLNSLDLVVPDGQPVRWAINLLHSAQLKDRVYGPNLTLLLCEKAAREDLPVFFYGSRQETLSSLAENLREKYPDKLLYAVIGDMR
jgi:UDP-N-acetyl-D-mannosaminuronic acid transferase (WecB/TagA/CpsF family)